MNKVIEIKNINFNKEDIINGVNYYQYNYQNNNLIAGEFKFKASEDKPRHTIMMASRFNNSSREENGPFPGWFVQIVGTSLSIGIGNGKTWKSIVSKSKVINNEWNHVAFCINNNTKKGSLYLNGHCDTVDNITFRKPCNGVTIGALNKKGEFKFNGELKEIKLGTELEEKIIRIENTNKDNIEQCIKESDKFLETIKENLININNDINSLKDIKSKITSWKYRGLQIDTSMLDDQINNFSNKISDFEDDTKLKSELLFNLDHKINPEDELIDKNNYLEFYSLCLHNLKNDVELLNNAVENLSKFRNLGIKLGDAFETIDEQKQNIINKITEARNDLKNRSDMTFEMMNLVTLNED
jgi:hypothetical protein